MNYFLETEKIMGRLVKDEKELAQAIKNNVDYIEVEGGIKDFFIKIHHMYYQKYLKQLKMQI